jgi:transcriptional regulator with XRE-family HTH domain
MARSYKELQDKMDPASRADNARGVREELQRMALDELRNAKRLTQAYLAEMLDTPQSSISRIEQRADMYLSTLRDYVHAMGGVLQIRAVFPDESVVTINRFGEYEDRSYKVRARMESSGKYRLDAQPVDSQPVDEGPPFSRKALKIHAFTKTLRALHIPESQIFAIRKDLETSPVEIGGIRASRIFSEPDLIAAGFEAAGTDQVNDR